MLSPLGLFFTRKMAGMFLKTSQAKVNTTISSLVAESGKVCASSWQGKDHASYEDAVEALHSLTSNASTIEISKKSNTSVAEQTIPKMKKYLERCGITMEDVNKLSVIHVSGTKGKGSTCAFSERILSCHGYTTGLYTSPHLFEVRERIRINGRPISKEKFCKYFWPIFNRLKKTEIPSRAEEGLGMPFYFSFLTILSIHVFLKEGVDVAILEVGIGGQYDNTNIFDRPVVCGVTALGMDHTNILGNSIEQIAWNKAGIFKHGRPAVVVQQEQAAMQVILDRARERNSPLFVSQTMPRQELNSLHIRLGIDCDKQAENASLAIHLTDLWMRLHNSDFVPGCVPSASSTIDDIPRVKVKDLHETTVEGLSTCVWHGRTQTIKREGTTYYLDGAHTKESMEVCTRWFKEKADKEKQAFGASSTVVRILIFNTTGDRDVGLFLSLLKDCNFDVALFCTNRLSTKESLNKPDQFHNAMSWRKMMEKATANKALWDRVVLSTPPPRPLPSYVVDNAINSTFLHSDAGLDAGPAADINSTCSGRQEPLGKLGQSSADQGLGGGKPPHACNMVDESGPGGDFNGCTAVDKTAPPKPSFTGMPASLAFPCILHALAWATQGRDPEVKVKDHRGINLGEAPGFLREAGHVQILITGSLHLVGGALEALTPDINS